MYVRLHAWSKYFCFECLLWLVDVYLIRRSRDIAKGSTDIKSGSFCLSFITMKQSEAEGLIKTEGRGIFIVTLSPLLHLPSHQQTSHVGERM